ncbi:MAG TPA: hypothetical protein VK997_15645, partial [Deferrisomatales bacterium]|nr:hypothetical protein [Deferrisomatales bacterium]
LYQDHALWSIDTPHTVAAKATVRAGQFLATVLGARAGQAAQDTVAAVVDVSVRLATEGIQAQVLFQDLLGTFSFDGGGGGFDPLGIAEGLLAGLFQGMGDPGVDFDRVLGQMQAGLAQAPNRLLADVASLMDALYAAPTAPPKDVARVLAAVGGALQSPVAGWLRDAGAPRPVPQLVGGVGGILAQADTPDFYLLAAATVGRTLAETFLPDQAGVVETLDWSAEFLAKYAARDLEGKLRALQAPDGLQDLGSRLEQRAGLPIPTVLVRAPLAGVLELAQRAGEMQSQSGQTAALGHVTAAVLNQVLPAVPTDSAVGTEPSRSFRCSAADGVEQHPAACLIRAVAEAGASGTSGSRQDFIRSAILLVTVAEDWALAGQGQAELRVTPLLWILHDLAEAGGSPEEVALTALIELPKLTQRVLAMADANPNWQPVLRLFGGDCSSASSRLSPPDQCGRNGLVNVLLAVLAEARIDTLATLPSPLGIPYGHLNDLEWGYLKTVPVLRPPAGSGASGDALSMAPDVGPSLDPASWEAMGENLGDPQKALVGGIDLARVFLNLASVLDGSRPDNYNRFAGEIIESSVFASLVGEEGEFFSGIAGGLLQHGQVGGTRGDLYLELLGQTKLPALTTIAAQASFRRSDETGAWGLRFRSGGDVPDVANLVDGFDGVGAAASAFDTVARTLDANAPVGLEWDLDAFLGASGGGATLGGSALVHAKLLGSNLGTLAMRGDLAVPDLTGQMCVRGSADVLAGLAPAAQFLSMFFGGWAAVPEGEVSLGGGLWSGSSYGGTGAAYMVGARSGGRLTFLGVDLSGLSVGVNVGAHLNAASGGASLGQCLTPYLQGHLGVDPLRY